MIVFQAPKPSVTVKAVNPIVGSGLFSVNSLAIHDHDTVDQVAKRLLKVCRSSMISAEGKYYFPSLKVKFDLNI